jgi:membrane-bound lytic murein transglycosylase A
MAGQPFAGLVRGATLAFAGMAGAALLASGLSAWLDRPVGEAPLVVGSVPGPAPAEPPVHGAPSAAVPAPPPPAPELRRPVSIPDAPVTDPVFPPLSAADIQITPVSFADLDGWAADDHASAWDAFIASCRAIDEKILPVRAALPVGPALQAVCREALTLGGDLDAASARRFFETRFSPWTIAKIGEEAGFITGYYEPVVDGSRVPTDVYTVPLRRRPDDLVESPANREGGRPVFGRTENGRIVPYFSRAEIEDGALTDKGTELVWLRDPVDAFFIHIQGSTRVRLPDGTMLRLNYDAQNGHRYVAVGRDLIDRGLVPREEMSLDRIRRWIGENPAEGRDLMRRNPSYIFFRETALADHEEAMGAQGIPLKAWRSIAVDRNLHVYGTPFFIQAELPIESAAPTTRFRQTMIAQDTGGAILGPARADIYVGAGDLAGQIAGRFRHPGRFIILLPRGIDPLAAGRLAPAPNPRGKGNPSKSGT